MRFCLRHESRELLRRYLSFAPLIAVVQEVLVIGRCCELNLVAEAFYLESRWRRTCWLHLNSVLLVFGPKMPSQVDLFLEYDGVLAVARRHDKNEI